MRHLIRSMRYLRPQRGRVLLSFACVVVVSVLWAGGLAAILPGAKVLLSPEGLHGWAYRRMTADRLDARVESRPTPKRLADLGRSALFVVKTGPACALSGKVWLTGLADGDHVVRPMAGPDLARAIAKSRTGQKVSVDVYDPADGSSSTVEVTLKGLHLSAEMLGWLAAKLPEPASYSDRFPLLVWLLVFGLVVTGLRGLLQVIHGYLTGSAVMYSVAQMRLDTYNSALALPVTFYSTEGFTDSMSRMLFDTSQVGLGQSMLISKLVLQPAKTVAAFAVALALSWKMTLLAIVAGPAVIFVIRRLGKMIRRINSKALRSFSEIVGILEQTLVGIRVVKTCTMEGAERRRFLQASKKLLRQRLRMMVLNSGTEVTVELLSALAGMLAVGVAGYWIFRAGSDMDGDTVLALMACLAAMYNAVRKLARIVPSLQAADAAAERVFELRDMPGEARTPMAPALARHAESITFERVCYRYPGTDRDVLKDVDLTVRVGQTVAVVGANGAGKTTLVSLLPRLMEPTSGRVLIDGKDIRRHSIRSLRRQIAFVPQETVIFHATVRDNISYGLVRPAESEVLAAARRAYVDEFVQLLPDGYDTVIGPQGATLSGGQRQRIAIARAILRKPAILIFDEALSNVDAESEKRIRQSMAELIASCTTFIIAHSFATAQWADEIVVMADGRAIDMGGHDELLAGCDVYRTLYNTQLAAYRNPIA